MNRRLKVFALCVLVLCALLAAAATDGARPSPYLFVWSSSTGPGNDFLATLDVGEGSPTYGQIVARLPVDIRRGAAHHTEHEMTPAGTLFANLFLAGRTYLFDLRQPLAPRILTQFDSVGPYMHPHSFVRRANGNILATFQMSGHGDVAPGGVIELTPSGEVLDVSPADDPNYSGYCRPYSMALVPRLDRIVSTCTDMEPAALGGKPTQAIQIWRLSDLERLKTIDLPNGPRGVEGANSSEPRLLPDGETVLVGTFNCGLYLLKNLATASPSAELVYDFKGVFPACALPVIFDHYWIQAMGASGPPSLVTLDIANPAKPVEVSRLELDPADHVGPHWLAREPYGRRIVFTGGLGESRVVLGVVASDGRVTLDSHLKEPGAGKPGIVMENAVPHGAVFSIP